MRHVQFLVVVALVFFMGVAAVITLLPACGSSRGGASPARSSGAGTYPPAGEAPKAGIEHDLMNFRSALPFTAPAIATPALTREAVADLSCLPARNEELWIIQRPGDASRRGNARTSDELPGSGALVASFVSDQPSADPTIPVPLKHTDVRGSIAGYISTVSVTQQFHNPFSSKIEATYVFPLPENAAVSDFVMTVGDRTIRGIIREREQAERIYQEARSQGYVATLLTEERPNIFTQKVANIEPGKSIDITITYYATLNYVDGSYEFVFPMVVGPRFNPPATMPATGAGSDDLRAGSVAAHRGSSTSSDGIGAVPRGASGISGQRTEVSYIRPGERSGHDIAISLSIDAAGTPIDRIESTTHVIETRRDGSRVDVRLSPLDSIPNKDFVLRYTLAQDRGQLLRSAFIAAPESRGTHFALMLLPPDDVASLSRQPLELVFVLDCSGSMSGEPITQAKRAIERALRQLRPDDTFQVIRFSSNADTLGPAPIRATPQNVSRGLEYVRGLTSEGGTMMIEGINAALDFPHDPSRLRFVTFLTDGYIGNEGDILAAIQNKLGPSRIFSFGVGSSVNRYLMDSMARVGRGCVAYITPGDSSMEVMDEFMGRISHPAMTDLSIDWGGLAVDPAEVFPGRLPDLFSGRPVIIAGKLSGDVPPGASIRISGRVAGQPRTVTVPVNIGASFGASSDWAETSRFGTPSPSQALAMVWARRKIADIAERATPSSAADDAVAIRSLALGYGLLSRYTAFLAVDSLTRTEGTFGTSVTMPVNVPEGVRYETTVPEHR